MAQARGPKQKAATREEFARLMEITHQDVTKLVMKGVLTRGAPIGQWLVEYGRHMKRVAAGWQSQDGYDLIAEKARLAANQADHVALLVAHKRGEVVPIPAMGEALNFLSATIRAKLSPCPRAIARSRREPQPKFLLLLLAHGCCWLASRKEGFYESRPFHGQVNQGEIGRNNSRPAQEWK